MSQDKVIPEVAQAVPPPHPVEWIFSPLFHVTCPIFRSIEEANLYADTIQREIPNSHQWERFIYQSNSGFSYGVQFNNGLFQLAKSDCEWVLCMSHVRCHKYVKGSTPLDACEKYESLLREEIRTTEGKIALLNSVFKE